MKQTELTITEIPRKIEKPLAASLLKKIIDGFNNESRAVDELYIIQKAPTRRLSATWILFLRSRHIKYTESSNIKKVH